MRLANGTNEKLLKLKKKTKKKKHLVAFLGHIDATGTT